MYTTSNRRFDSSIQNSQVLTMPCWTQRCQKLPLAVAKSPDRHVRRSFARHPVDYKLRLRVPLPLVQKADLFKLFSPAEWVDSQSLGRKIWQRCCWSLTLLSLQGQHRTDHEPRSLLIHFRSHFCPYENASSRLC